MNDKWQATGNSSELRSKIKAFTDALNIIMKAVIDVEKQRVENMKKTVEYLAAQKRKK